MGQAWTQQQDTGPSPRSHHTLAFDLVHSRVVLFGGNPGAPASLGDTWSWDGSIWMQLATFGANPCFNAAMVSTDLQIVLFGGMDSSNAAFRETWVFDGKHWTHRQDIGPLARFSHAMSYDAATYHCPLRWARPYRYSAAGHMGAHRNGSTSAPYQCIINNSDTHGGFARRSGHSEYISHVASAGGKPG
jgi:hypothetical protein